MEMLHTTFLILSCIVLINGLTHPLPDEENKLMNEQIKCGPGQEFKWDRTDPNGNDIKLTYRCGGTCLLFSTSGSATARISFHVDGAVQTKSFSCKNGYKASSKRDAVCDPGPDPNFGIFREGKDPNVMDTARIVYFCMKQSDNTLPRC